MKKIDIDMITDITYRLVENESMLSIAKDYNLSLSDIMKVNMGTYCKYATTKVSVEYPIVKPTKERLVDEFKLVAVLMSKLHSAELSEKYNISVMTIKAIRNNAYHAVWSRPLTKYINNSMSMSEPILYRIMKFKRKQRIIKRVSIMESQVHLLCKTITELAEYIKKEDDDE